MCVFKLCKTGKSRKVERNRSMKLRLCCAKLYITIPSLVDQAFGDLAAAIFWVERKFFAIGRAMFQCISSGTKATRSTFILVTHKRFVRDPI